MKVPPLLDCSMTETCAVACSLERGPNRDRSEPNGNRNRTLLYLERGHLYRRKAARPKRPTRLAPEAATRLPAPLKELMAGVAGPAGEPVPVADGTTTGTVLLAKTGGGTTTLLTAGGDTTPVLKTGGGTTPVLKTGGGATTLLIGGTTTAGVLIMTAAVLRGTGTGVTGTGLVMVQGQLVIVIVEACGNIISLMQLSKRTPTERAEFAVARRSVAVDSPQSRCTSGNCR